MAIAKREAVEPIIDQFAPRIRAVLDRAMDDWLQIPSRGQFLYSRTGANIIFDNIIRHGLLEFSGDGSDTVRVLREAQTVKFMFHNSVVVRFKRGNVRGVGSNIQTQAVLNFVDPQGSFGGLPDIHRTEIVYQLDILGTGFAEVSVVARDRTTRIWAYPLNGRPSAEIIPLPTRTPPVLTPPIVTPKASPDEKSGEEEKPE